MTNFCINMKAFLDTMKQQIGEKEASSYFTAEIANYFGVWWTAQLMHVTQRLEFHRYKNGNSFSKSKLLQFATNFSKSVAVYKSLR